MSRRNIYAVAAFLVAAVIVIAAGVIIHRRNTPDPVDQLPPDVATAVTLKARAAVENGASMDLGGDLGCVTRLLGTDPAKATTTDQITTAYVWVLCGQLHGPTESSLPLAVHFTDQPTADAPGDGAINTSDKKRIFPKRLWNAVIDGPDDGDALEAAMNQRRRELS